MIWYKFLAKKRPYLNIDRQCYITLTHKNREITSTILMVINEYN